MPAPEKARLSRANQAKSDVVESGGPISTSPATREHGTPGRASRTAVSAASRARPPRTCSPRRSVPHAHVCPLRTRAVSAGSAAALRREALHSTPPTGFTKAMRALPSESSSERVDIDVRLRGNARARLCRVAAASSGIARTHLAVFGKTRAASSRASCRWCRVPPAPRSYSVSGALGSLVRCCPKQALRTRAARPRARPARRGEQLAVGAIGAAADRRCRGGCADSAGTLSPPPCPTG
jgi:hypothetical protein